MNSFKDTACQILEESGKSLRSKKSTKIAINRGWLKTAGKTPEATMNAQLIVDINSKKEKLHFIKTAPSVFGLNPNFKETSKAKSKKLKEEKIYKTSKDISTKQKGDIAEARIAELIILYGDTTLSCYKPLSDDKGSLKTMYLQVKRRFGDNPGTIIYAARTKISSAADNYSVALAFCFFDINEGDLWDYLWFVPAPNFIKMANKLDNGKMLGFVAGRKKKESNKCDEYLIDKRGLANEILKRMNRL